jgi:hypothetical protein
LAGSISGAVVLILGIAGFVCFLMYRKKHRNVAKIEKIENEVIEEKKCNEITENGMVEERKS